ncbi:MAG: hypothetical protein L6R40_002831 [Gallowayella cf. fulva]|nr:MAG: hypothetical protein L6R40_002831 [Xanthomendoza cf. fulva]
MVKQKPIATNGSNFTTAIHHNVYPAIDFSNLSFDGQRVFISGASKGIGRAAAIAYAKAGAAVICLGARSDLSQVEIDVQEAVFDAGKKPPKVLKVNLDVSSRPSVEAAAEAVGECCQSIDVLVNNAGYHSRFESITDSDPDDWWRSWETNIYGTYLMTRSFLPLLLQGSGKTIINLTSIAAHFLVNGASAYSTGKLAMLRFCEFTNVEYGAQGILAYTVHPGGVATELATNVMPKAMQNAMLIDTEELAGNTIVYLTQQRQEWLAGRYVSVNWDMEELFAKKDEIVEKDLLRVRMAVE